MNRTEPKWTEMDKVDRTRPKWTKLERNALLMWLKMSIAKINAMLLLLDII